MLKYWGKLSRQDTKLLSLETSKMCLGNAGSSLTDMENWHFWQEGARGSWRQMISKGPFQLQSFCDFTTESHTKCRCPGIGSGDCRAGVCEKRPLYQAHSFPNGSNRRRTKRWSMAEQMLPATCEDPCHRRWKVWGERRNCYVLSLTLPLVPLFLAERTECNLQQ